MSSVRLEHVTRRFDGHGGIGDISLNVRAGEFLTLLGPSGCGKTTTLRLVAGFEKPDSGRLRFDEEDVTDVPPERRGIGMVFQSYALFPHLDVFENVGFGLRTRGVRGTALAARIRKALEIVGLAGTGLRKVQSLSGGQQQRVALARAIVIEPRILLLDEPLSNLDVLLREETRGEIRRVQKTLGTTTLYVTHDREEALAVSDRVAVLRSGRLEQVGTPEEVFSSPATAFVAGFVGGANLLSGRADTLAGGRLRVAFEHGGSLETRAQPGVSIGSSVTLAIRPTSLKPGQAARNPLAGRIVRCEYRGDTARCWVDVEALGVQVEAVVAVSLGLRLQVGAPIELSVAPEDVLAFRAEGAAEARHGTAIVEEGRAC